MTENSSGHSGNAFEADKPGTSARSLAEAQVERLREKGGIFVKAVRATRMPMAVTDPSLPGNPIIFANEAFLQLSGYSMAEVLGQQPHFMNGEETDEADAVRFRAALEEDRDEVIETVQYRKDGSRFVGAVFLSAFKNENGRTLHQFLSYFDITRRVAAEEQLASREKMEVRLRASEARLRALATAGSTMIYRMSPDWQRMYQLDGRDLLADTPEPVEDWADTYLLPEDRPAIFAAIDAAIRTKSLFELEHRVRRADGGLSWVISRAVPILGADGDIVEWFGVGSDVTERWEAQQSLREAEERHRSDLEQQVRERTAELRASHDLLQATMDASTDMIQVFEAIRDGAGEIVDFRWVLNNHTSESKYGKIEGESLLQRNPGVVEEGILDAFKRVTETGEPEQAERHYAHEQFDGWFYQSVVKLGDGVATTTKEITEWKEAQAEVLRLQDEIAGAKLRESEENYRVLFESIDEGFCTIEVLFDDAGAPVDYRFLQINPAFERQTGLFDAVGRTMRDLAPEHESHWFDTYGRIALTGEPARFENRAAALGRWYDVYAFRIGEPEQRRVAILFRDILQRKRADAALRESEARFRAFVTASSDVVYRMSPDWAEMRQLDGRGFVADTAEPNWGWMDSYIHPEDQETVRAAIDRAIETRSVFELEHRIIRVDGTLGWTLSRAVPLLDEHGEIVEWLGAASDVTTRREAEDARRENEARQAFLLELSDRLRSAGDAQAAMSAAAELFARRLGVAFAQYCLLEADGDSFNVAAGYSDGRMPGLQQPGRISDHGTGWGPQFRNGEAIFSDDHDRRQPADVEASRAFGVRSGSTVPLIRDGRLVAIFSTANPEPRRWTEAEKALQHEVAERTWAAVERARVEAALHESEERLRQFGEASSDVLWTRDARTLDWEYLTPAFEAIYGVSRDEALRGDNFRNWTDLIVPEDREAAVAAIGRVQAGERATFEYRVRRPLDGAVRWLRETDFPILGEDETVQRIGGVGHDVTELKRAEVAIAESERRFRSMATSIEDVFYMTDLDERRLLYLSPSYERVWGRPAAELLADLSRFAGTIHPDDRERVRAGMERQAQGEPIVTEYRIVRPDGAVRWIADRSFPVLGQEGRLSAGLASDMTERKRTALRLTSLVEGIPQLVWRAVDHGEWIWASPQWTAFTGQSNEDSQGRGWLDPVHPDDRQSARDAWERSKATGEFHADYRLLEAATGRYRFFQTRATLVKERGEIVEWLGTSTDVHQMRELQDRQGVLVAELQHRTRNLITVVRSVAQQTMALTGPGEAFHDQFNDRLSALARVQGLLSRANEEPITIGVLLRMELDALGAKEFGGRVRLAGPEVSLRNTVVQTLALALHELATNARKYGALSSDQGNLDISWSVDLGASGRSRLNLKWIEQGASRINGDRDPSRTGYGRELIERALPYALNAKTSFELSDDGVRCTIDLPLDKRAGSGDRS